MCHAQSIVKRGIDERSLFLFSILKGDFMQKEFITKGRYLVVTVGEELDQYQAERIRENCKYYLEGTRIKNVIFDFSNTKFMDSAGIGVITGRYKQVKRLGGLVYVVGVTREIIRIFLISGLKELVVIKKSIDEVLIVSNDL